MDSDKSEYFFNELGIQEEQPHNDNYSIEFNNLDCKIPEIGQFLHEFEYRNSKFIKYIGAGNTIFSSLKPLFIILSYFLREMSLLCVRLFLTLDLVYSMIYLSKT